MTTVLVQYHLPPGIDRAACRAHFERIAPGFRGVPGLLRKQFIHDPRPGGASGGVYTWETRADAERFYAGPWRDGIRQRYGTEPVITYFETFAVTDNVLGAVTVCPDEGEGPPARSPG